MKRVVIVDDHPVVARGLRAIFEENGKYVITGVAVNMDDAMVLLHKDPPDILLADVELGCGLSGIDLVRNASETFPGIRIIVMSMDDGSLYAERAIKAGAMGFISKVDLADSVFTAIETVINGKIYLSREVCDIIACNHFRNFIKSAPATDIANLSVRELEVFQLIGRGYRRDEIADKLDISINTFEVHRRKIRMKLHVGNASELTKIAIQHAAERFNIQP